MSVNRENIDSSKNIIRSLFLVDDEDAIRESCKILLENRKYNVVQFKSGKIFLEYFSKKENADLVILDVNLAGISGIDVLREIRKKNKNIPVLLISGDYNFQKSAYAEYQPLYFFNKPFMINDLIEMIKKIEIRFNN